MLLHVWTEHPQSPFATHLMAHRLHVEQCMQSGFSGRGTLELRHTIAGCGKTTVGKLTSNVGFFSIIFLLSDRRSSSGSPELELSPSLGWRVLRFGLGRCPGGDRGLLLHWTLGLIVRTRQLLPGALPISRSGRTVRGPRCACRPADTLLHDVMSFLTSLHCFALPAGTALAAASQAGRVAFMFTSTSIFSTLGLSRSAHRSPTAVAWSSASASAWGVCTRLYRRSHRHVKSRRSGAGGISLLCPVWWARLLAHVLHTTRTTLHG